MLKSNKYQQLHTNRIPKSNIKSVILPSVAQYLKKTPKQISARSPVQFQIKTKSSSQDRISKSSSPKNAAQNKVRVYSQGCRTEKRDQNMLKERINAYIENYKNLKVESTKSKESSKSKVNAKLLESQELILRLKQANHNPGLKVRTEECERTSSFCQQKDPGTERILDLLFLSTQELKDVFAKKQPHSQIKSNIKIRVPRCNVQGFPQDFFSIF